MAELSGPDRLALYVLGELTPRERAAVEAELRGSPELRAELRAVEQTLEALARERAVAPPSSALAGALAQIEARGPSTVGQTEKPGAKSGVTRRRGAAGVATALLLALTLIGAVVYLLAERSRLRAGRDRASADLVACLQREERGGDAVALLRELGAPGVRRVEIQAAEPSADIGLALFSAAAERNYLARTGVPNAPPGEAYQLWALPPDADPVPLDVFAGGSGVVAVRSLGADVDYAVTVEDEDGAATPNLDRLVGTFPLASTGG